MRNLFVLGLIVFGVYYTLMGGSGIISTLYPNKTALLIHSLSEKDLNELIMKHYKTVILDDAPNVTVEAIETIIVDLNEDGAEDVLAIPEGSNICGTGGCTASIFIANEKSELIALPFSYAVKKIEVLDTITNGMHELRLNGDEKSKMIWDGSTYILEQL